MNRLSSGNLIYGLSILAVVGLAAFAALEPRTSAPDPIVVTTATPEYRPPTPTAEGTATPLPDWWEPTSAHGVMCSSTVDMRMNGFGHHNLTGMVHPPVDRARLNELIPELAAISNGRIAATFNETGARRIRILGTECWDSWSAWYDVLNQASSSALLEMMPTFENPASPTEAEIREAFLTHWFVRYGPDGAVDVALEVFPLEAD